MRLLVLSILAGVASAQSLPPAQVQALLQREGYSVTVDGQWGPSTRAALMNFQASQGLPVTGALDPVTAAALAGTAPSNPVPTQPRAGAPVAMAEAMLSAEFGRYDFQTVDLNGDGMSDVIGHGVYPSPSCGAANCGHVILLNTGAGFRPVYQVLTIAIEVGPGSTNGMRDLIAHGTARVGRVPLRWTGTTYAR